MRLQSRGQKLRPSSRVKLALPAKKANSFYSTPEWRELIVRIIAKRGRHCQDPTHDPRRAREGIRVFGDHIVELGDGGAPLDEANVLLRCGSCHTRKTAQARLARMTSGFGSWDSAPHPGGLKASLIPLTIVCGPPASGKSTYAINRVAGDGLVIDLDEIAAGLSGGGSHGWDRRWLSPALARRNYLLRCLGEPSAWSEAWLIVGEPEARWRQWWHDHLRPHQVVVLAINEDVCWSRIAADPARQADRGEVSHQVALWWAQYTPRPGEITIKSPEGG